jgi:hypothetical protein
MKLPPLNYSAPPLGRDQMRRRIEAALVDVAPREVGGVLIPAPRDREELRLLRRCLGVSISQVERLMGVSSHAASTMFAPRTGAAIRKSSLRNYTAALRLGVAELRLPHDELSARVAEYHSAIQKPQEA